MRANGLFWLLMTILLSSPVLADTKIKERELAEVRAEIRKLKAELGAKTRERERLDAALAESEQGLRRARGQLAATESDLDTNLANLKALNSDIAEEERLLGDETTKLGKQLRDAYMRGRGEQVQLLLNQQSPAEFGRTMAYYGYLNSARENNIAAVRGGLQRLDQLRTDATATTVRLRSLKATRQQQFDDTESERDQRQSLLADIESEIAATGGTVADLGRREADLERLILELTSILADYPISSEEPFAKHRGTLTWPISGRLVHDFGQPRDGGEIKWNGVLLAAERGREVRALYHGRIAFADRLAGLGLLLVIDHGDGYMSLYGHNDELLKSVGDWVGAGDAVATVGDTGGQNQPGLYLEIRNGKKPLNPSRWISKRPRPSGQ